MAAKVIRNQETGVAVFLALFFNLTSDISYTFDIQKAPLSLDNMKAALFALFIVFSFASVARIKPAAHIKNDLSRQKLKGNIKSITESDYNASQDTLRWKIIYYYNTTGNLASFETYSSSGVLFSRSICTYNDSNNLIDQKRYKADGSLFDRTVYKYDERGNKIEEDDYDALGKQFQRVSFIYDGKGNRINKDCYNEYGALFLKCNYKFDGEGKEIQVKEYDSHHGLRFITTYDYEDYDRRGNWLTQSVYKNDDLFSVIKRVIIYY